MTIGEIWERLRELQKIAGSGGAVNCAPAADMLDELRVEIARLIGDIERYQRSLGLHT